MNDPYLRLLNAMRHCKPIEYALRVLDKEGCDRLFMGLNAEQRCVIDVLCNEIEHGVQVDFSVIPSAFSRANDETRACTVLYVYVCTHCQNKGG